LFNFIDITSPAIGSRNSHGTIIEAGFRGNYMRKGHGRYWLVNGNSSRIGTVGSIVGNGNGIIAGQKIAKIQRICRYSVLWDYCCWTCYGKAVVSGKSGYVVLNDTIGTAIARYVLSRYSGYIYFLYWVYGKVFVVETAFGIGHPKGIGVRGQASKYIVVTVSHWGRRNNFIGDSPTSSSNR